MARGFTPMIGLAVVVALAMVAVFGAMSLADPAQADISGGSRNGPTAMAIMEAAIVEPESEDEEAPVAPKVNYSFPPAEYTASKFAGDEDATWVIEFRLTGDYLTGDSIVMELPKGSEGELPDGTDIEDIFDVAGRVTVQGPRDLTDPDVGATTRDAITVGDIDFDYPDDNLPNYVRGSKLVDDETVRHLVLPLTESTVNTVDLRGEDGGDSSATTYDPDPVRLRVTLTGMTNPTTHGDNPINIYHFKAADTDGDADNGVIVPSVDGPETADLEISSVMVEAEKDDDELTGLYTLTFFAQEDYAARSMLDIEMGGVQFTYDEIDAADVSIKIGSGTERTPRSVELNSGTATVSIGLPRAISEGDEVVVVFLDSAGIINPTEAGTYEWVVAGAYSSLDNNGLVVAAEDVEEEEERVTDDAVPSEGLPSFMPDSNDPGKNTRYTVEFDVKEPVNTLLNDLVIEFHEDYSVPALISTSAVTIRTGPYPDDTDRSEGGDADDDPDYYTFTPEDIAVDGNEVFISIGDITEDDDKGVYSVGGVYDVEDDNENPVFRTMKVVFRQSAGISNPTENGGYALVAVTFGDAVEIDNGDEEIDTLGVNVPRKISLSEGDGGLGDTIKATGKGYKNSTTLTVYVDQTILIMWDHDNRATTDMVPLNPGKIMVDAYKAAIAADDERGNVPYVPVKDDGSALHVDPDGYAWAPNGKLDLGEDELCMAPRIGSDDVGTCEFNITHPTFAGGLNYINAVDGRDGYAPKPDTFVLKASISASPAGGSPGEIMVIQVVDFPPSRAISDVQIARQSVVGASGSVDSTGAGNFPVTIPNWVKAGAQELRISVIGDDGDPVRASTNIDLLGPQINVTPGTVLANQRISLVGTGFSPGAVVANESDSAPGSVLPEVSIGGRVIEGSRINDNDPVRVDNGGNWSASVDLPLAEATTADGERVIRVSDSRGRSGVETVTIPTREVTVTPNTGRVGTIAVVRGSGFPSKNDEGSSFNIEIVYDASNGNTSRFLRRRMPVGGSRPSCEFPPRRQYPPATRLRFPSGTLTRLWW